MHAYQGPYGDCVLRNLDVSMQAFKRETSYAPLLTDGKGTSGMSTKRKSNIWYLPLHSYALCNYGQGLYRDPFETILGHTLADQHTHFTCTPLLPLPALILRLLDT